MIARRALLLGSILTGPASVAAARAAEDCQAGLEAIAAELERRHGGRLGVAVLETARARLLSYRGDERFAMCSTYKFIVAALVLARADRHQESLGRRVIYNQKDLVSYSPITERHVDSGLTVAELCAAAVTVGDNTAANLLMDGFGGPAAVTAYVRSLGDNVTRLDRPEPALNEVRPGDQRDTTSPVAMLDILRQTALGTALSPISRAQLTDWMVASKTGDHRIRAGLPGGWRVGDKTGSGDDNATNDVAVIWPPRLAPLVMTAFYVGSSASPAQRNEVLAELGRRAVAP